MVSRRHLLGTFGVAAGSLLAGCGGLLSTVTGTIKRKKVTVAVPQRTGDSVHTSLALLYYESDENVVHGSYDPKYVDENIEDGDFTVSAQTHRILDEEFESVRYYVNVAPDTDETPANGLVDRETFDELTVGGTASVGTFSGSDGVGHLRVHETAPRDSKLSGTVITQADVVDRSTD